MLTDLVLSMATRRRCVDGGASGCNQRRRNDVSNDACVQVIVVVVVIIVIVAHKSSVCPDSELVNSGSDDGM